MKRFLLSRNCVPVPSNEVRKTIPMSKNIGLSKICLTLVFFFFLLGTTTTNSFAQNSKVNLSEESQTFQSISKDETDFSRKPSSVSLMEVEVDCNFDILYENPTCGVNNGLITVIPADQNGSTIYYYELTDPFGVTFINATYESVVYYDQMPAGDYSLTVTLFMNPDECQQTYEFALENDYSDCVPCEFEASSIASICGEPNGEILLVNAGQDGSTSFTYEVTDSEGNSVLSIASIVDSVYLSNLLPGEYSVNIGFTGNPDLCNNNYDLTIETNLEGCNLNENCAFDVLFENPECGSNNGLITVVPEEQDGSILYFYELTDPLGVTFNNATFEDSVFYDQMPAGDYSLHITLFMNAEECEQTYEFSLIDDFSNCAPCEFVVSGVDSQCGEPNGQIIVFNEGQEGNTSFDYELLDADGNVIEDITSSVDSLNFGNLSPGDYSVNIVFTGHPEFCETSYDFTIAINNEGCATENCEFEVIYQNPECGSNNGLITVVPAEQDGATIYFYELTDPSGVTFNNATFEDSVFYDQMPVGDYFLRVTLFMNAEECEATYEFALEDDYSNCAPCEFTTGGTASNCGAADGSLEISNAGQTGNTPFDYELVYQDGSGETITSIEATLLFENLLPGDYTLNIQYAGNPDLCSTSYNLTVNDECEPACDFIVEYENPKCGLNNGIITVTPTIQDGNTLYFYQLTDPFGVTFNNATNEFVVLYDQMQTGDYHLEVTNFPPDGTCFYELDFTLEDDFSDCAPCEFEASFDAPTCGEENGEILVVATGQDGVTNFRYDFYEVSGISPIQIAGINSIEDSIFIGNIAPGDYVINVSFQNNPEFCYQEFTFTIENDQSGCVCEISAGSIGTNSNTDICSYGDTVVDTVEVFTNNVVGQVSYYVTNQNGTAIFAGPLPGPIFTFEGAMAEICMIWGIVHCSELSIPTTNDCTIWDIESEDSLILMAPIPINVYDCSEERSHAPCPDGMGAGSISSVSQKVFCREEAEMLPMIEVDMTGQQTDNLMYVVTDIERSYIKAGPYSSNEIYIDAVPGESYKILGIGYNGEMTNIGPGVPIADLTTTGCFEYTNTIEVYVFDCAFGMLCSIAQPGEISTNDNTDFCSIGDNQVNFVHVNSTGNISNFFEYIVTDGNGMVIDGPFSNSNSTFTFEGYPEGTYKIRGIAYEGTLEIPMGAHYSNLISSECYYPTNAIELNLSDCSGASLCNVLENGEIGTNSETDLCAVDGGSYAVDMYSFGNEGTYFTYILTDAATSEILAGPFDDSSIEIDLTNVADYRIRGIAYEGELSLTYGLPVYTGISSTECYEYTFSVLVTVSDCGARFAPFAANNDQENVSFETAKEINVMENDVILTCQSVPVIINSSAKGSVEVLENGSILYTPADGFVGQDKIVYMICCGSKCELAEVTIEVLPDAMEAKMSQLMVPNTFSPNLDGINDLFTIPGLEEYFPGMQVEMTIFNRIGQLIYSTENFESLNQWDGTEVGGNLAAPQGTYYFALKIENEGKIYTKTGFIELRK